MEATQVAFGAAATQLAGMVDEAVRKWNGLYPDRMIVIDRVLGGLVDQPTVRRYQHHDRELVLRFFMVVAEGEIARTGVIGGGTLGIAGKGTNLLLLQEPESLHWKSVDVSEGMLSRGSRQHILASSGDDLANWMLMDMNVHGSIQLAPRIRDLAQAPDVTSTDIERYLRQLTE